MSEETKRLTWREKTVIKILFLVARIVSGDKTLCAELFALHNHISTGLGEDR